MRQGFRSTNEGEHRAVLAREVLDLFDPKPGQVAVDCTVGWGGHAAELLPKLGPDGFLFGLDLDAENLAKAQARLEAIGGPFALHHGNFAGATQVVQGAGRPGVDMLLADLGFSSMQVDDPSRGFSYRRDGPLDMRLDRSRGKTVAQLLQTIPQKELADALRDFADEPNAGKIARAIVQTRATRPIETTHQLAQFLMEIVGETEWKLQPKPGVWKIHPAARSFQALRILVNRELANLEHLLRILPTLLNPGGVAAIISFHSGEDRLVKASFREGKHLGHYAAISEDPVRAGFDERGENPRSRSAKLRWARTPPKS